MAYDTAPAGLGFDSVALKDLDVPCANWRAMQDHWELVHDLRGGTLTMRERRTRWLPQEDGESNDHYDTRIRRTVLYEGYANTVDDIAGKPFSEEVTVTPDTLDEQLQPIESDADYEGTTLTQFCKDVLVDGIDHGLVHLFADYPVDSAGVLIEDIRAQQLHPYFTHVSAANLIWWASRKASNGRRILTEMRVREWGDPEPGREAKAGAYRIRVFREAGAHLPVEWELFEKSAETWASVGAGRLSVSEIPLVTGYFRKTGFMQGRPCLEGLAWLNLLHWQSSSDQRHSLHFARVPMMYESGTATEDVAKPIVVGAGKCIRNVNPNAKLTVVEHSGAAIEAGQRDLDMLESRMEAMGAEPLAQNRQDVTATGQVIDATRQMSKLEAWVRSLETLLWRGYQLAAAYIEVELPEDFAVKIFDDFGLPAKAQAECDFLLRQRQAGELSRKTFLREVARRGVYAEDFNVDDEAEAIAVEGPRLGNLFGGSGGQPPPEDAPPFDEGGKQAA